MEYWLIRSGSCYKWHNGIAGADRFVNPFEMNVKKIQFAWKLTSIKTKNYQDVIRKKRQPASISPCCADHFC